MKKTLRIISLTGLILCLLFLPAQNSVSQTTAGYNSPGDVIKMAENLQKQYSKIVNVSTLATTAGGNRLIIIKIGKNVANESAKDPAILVSGNMSGNRPVTTMAAMNLANRLTADQDLLMGYDWYIIPVGNPDAYGEYFSKVKAGTSLNSMASNDDKDELTDEDGPDDLNNDGFITSLRVKSPDGEWMVVDNDPRLMRKADKSKDEKGIYTIYPEGIDNDNDGKINEDRKGGVDVDINFPHLFKYFGTESGLYPGSAPESFAIMKFAYDHPELAMVFSFGETNFLYSPPRGGRQGSVDMDKITIPEEIGKMLGFETNRTYSMSEIMEKVKPMVPPGMDIDEGMVASFLGLGAIVNPMKEDLEFYNKISKEYKDYIKEKGSGTGRFDPKAARDGSFELWAYYHLGLPVFSNDVWSIPKPEEKKKVSSGITAESLGEMSSDEFLALGEEKINQFLKEIGAPDQYNATMVIGAVKGGQLNPKQISGMLSSMPKPKADEQKGDPVEVATLAFWNNYREDSGFAQWEKFTHPTLGEVEIGGFLPYTGTTPPAEILDSIMEIEVPFIFNIVKELPDIKIGDIKTTAKGDGIYSLEVWIENDHYLPFTTAMGKRNKIPPPAILTIEGDGIEIISGKKRTPVNELAGLSSTKLVWIIKSDKSTEITLKLVSGRAGSDSKKIKIGG